MTETTLPKTHSVYAHLLRELPLAEVIWLQNGNRFTAAELLQFIEQDEDLGAEYARAVLTRTLEIFAPRNRLKPSITDNLDVSVSPRAVCAEQFRYLPHDHVVWRTMSKTFHAGEMADLLENTQDADAKQFVSEGLRLARDLIHRCTIP